MDPNRHPMLPTGNLAILLKNQPQQQSQQQPLQYQHYQQFQYQQPLARDPMIANYPGPMQHVPQPNMPISLVFRPAPSQAPRQPNAACVQNNRFQPFGYAPAVGQNQQSGGFQQLPAQPGSSMQFPVAVEGRSLKDILATLAQFAPPNWAAPAQPVIKVEDTEDDIYYPQHVTGFDGVRIKEETPDEDRPTPARPQRPRRDGITPDTSCHNATHLIDQPHHHRLKCGHEVFTTRPQPCGINCEVPRGSQPPTQMPFMCPDVGCERQWKRQERQEQKVFAVRQDGQRDRKPGHICFRSETEGTSDNATAQRNTEVFRKLEELKHKVLGGPAPQRQPRRKAARGRERSRSPERDANAGNSKHRERSPLLDANVTALLEMNRHQEPLVGLTKASDMSMVPEHVAEEQKPWTYKDSVSAAGPGELAYKTGHVTEWSMPANRINDPNRAGIFQAVDDDVVSRQAQQFPDWEFDVQQKHCVCQVSADGYMLPCTDCGLFFHPLCVGKATQVMTEYGSEKDDEARLKDRQYWHDSDKFTCNFCDNRRAAKSRDMSFKQQETERRRVRKEFERLEDGARYDEAEAVDFFGFICGGCYERIIDSRFRCSLCPDADKSFLFCSSCAENPKMTVAHKHENKSAPKNGGARSRQMAKVKAGEDVSMTG